ncbi:hypothetical protein CL646_03250 [bacterium]|nr:hypothetical protein [bacterium]|tara:strand:+ start:1221 stop:1841 length:621 start_codon:yes stop_codon:yes gene_type:complete
MRNLNTKGFSLIELIVVIAIIGAIAAAGIPNFVSWNADRKVRNASDNTASLITTLNTQTQRGVYPFTQILITPGNNLRIEAKGKTKRSINTLLNGGGNLSCDIGDDLYWDESVSTLDFEDIFVQFENESAICFSKNADNYTLEGDIAANADLITSDNVTINNYLIFCTSQDDCDIEPERPAYMVVWSRFGNISKFRYSSQNEWIMQ